jgi:hypothetical protein
MSHPHDTRQDHKGRIALIGLLVAIVGVLVAVCAFWRDVYDFTVGSDDPPAARTSAGPSVASPPSTEPSSGSARPESPEAAPPSPGTARLVSSERTCVSVPKAPESEVYLIVGRCDGSDRQTWIYGEDGTFRIGGLCMDAPQHTDGHVWLYACDAGPPQTFRLRASGELTVSETGRCLTIGSNTSEFAHYLMQVDCQGNPVTRWSFE